MKINKISFGESVVSENVSERVRMIPTSLKSSMMKKYQVRCCSCEKLVELFFASAFSPNVVKIRK